MMPPLSTQRRSVKDSRFLSRSRLASERVQISSASVKKRLLSMLLRGCRFHLLASRLRMGSESVQISSASVIKRFLSMLQLSSEKVQISSASVMKRFLSRLKMASERVQIELMLLLCRLHHDLHSKASI